MTGSSSPLAADEAARIRESYERSLSWRLTRPLRATAGVIRRLRGGDDRAGASPDSAPGAAAGAAAGGFDWWLAPLYDDELSAIDAACTGAGPEALAAFRGLDDDLWAVLLSRDYTRYPNIRALLPEAPEPELQMRWNGASGLELLGQSKAFYGKARARFAEHSSKSLADARVLDFGCGWGRLTRFFARDTGPGSLHACDPVEDILEVCRRTRVPARLARSDFLPERLPFDERFDLVFSFSVFTHLSERAHERCLRAIHRGLEPGGLLIVTIRPPAYIHHSPFIAPALDELGADPLAALAEPRYLFVGHGADPSHPQYADGEMDYGETVISLPYLRERWGELFELLEIDLLTSDLYQVMATLRRR
jgi:SAM-dependent methyltransferase